MKGPGEVVISGAVEGLLDEAVLIRLIEDSGATPGLVYGKMGKNHLQKHLRAYNQAAPALFRPVKTVSFSCPFIQG
jgi:hypothetical protein